MSNKIDFYFAEIVLESRNCILCHVVMKFKIYFSHLRILASDHLELRLTAD